jgi:hypothetical protein
VTSKKKKPGAGGGAEREAEGAAVGAALGVAEVEAGPDAPQDLYSLRQLAGLLKVDRNGLAERVRDLESFQGAHGSRLYSLSAVEEVLAEDPDPDLKEARLRKLVAEAGLAELKLKRERRELVDYREVLSDHLEVFRNFHTLFTVTVPQRLGQRLALAKTAQEAEEILRVELAREFQEFRTEEAQYLDNWDEAEGLKTEEANDDE